MKQDPVIGRVQFVRLEGESLEMEATSYLSQASCVIVSGFTAALDLDTYPLRNVHGAENELNLVEVSQCSLCILAF